MKDKRETVLEINNLSTSFLLKNGKELKAVNQVSFDIQKGEMLGLAGESGSGKSMMLKSIFRIVPAPGKITGGEIIYRNENILAYPEKKMCEFRGKEFSMIFQEPMSALNPSFSVGWQIEEVYKLHGKYTRKQRREMAMEMLHMVRIPDPEKRIREYPFQFSGGMRQRVLIAIALACNPAILFADEPTTALDVTVQADIMDLLDSLRHETHVSMLLISHNLNLLAERCERIVVMYCGQLMEIAPTRELLSQPAHPYTVGLLNSTVDIERPDAKYTAIPGDIADATTNNTGCMFAPRCSYANTECFERMPNFSKIATDHFCRCHRVGS